MKKYFKKVMDWRIIPAIVSVILFLNKVMPLFQLSFYNHSNADDYWMSVSIHKVWENTHSLVATIGEALNSAVMVWHDWGGCFLSMFLSGLAPVVFHENYYKYTFYIIGGTLILSIIIFMYVLCVRVLKFHTLNVITLCALVLTVVFNFSPSIKEGMYWWCGGINYTFFFAVFLLSQACLLEYMVSGRKIFLGIGAFMALCTGMGNLLSALVNPVILIFECLGLFILRKEKKKDNLLFLIPVLCGIIGLMINVMAPGNLVRGGSGLFENSAIDAIIDTIVISTGLMKSFYRKPVIWFIIAVFAIVLDTFYKKGTEYRFRYPVLFVIMSYLVYCAAFTPVVYAKNAVYGRCEEVSFLFLVILIFCCIIYVTGWLYVRFLKDKPAVVPHVLLYASMILVLIFSKVDRLYFDSSYAVDALTSGAAQNFHDKVNARFAMYYNPEVKQVEVQTIDWYPGLFYFDDDCLVDIAYYFDKEYIIVVD